jgi:hypothetical protein
VWLKNRNYGAGTNHVLVDSVRGASLGLASNLTNADFSNTGNFSSINSNGFTVAGTTRDYNFLSDTFVAWQWKEGATPGFDIVTYTGNGSSGTNINHSLGVKPAMIVFKSRTSPSPDPANWVVEHQSLSGGVSASSTTFTLGNFTSALYLNLTSAAGSYTMDGQINRNAVTYVAYLFAEVAGFSKAFSYTGNGSADGPFIFCGFRPRWVMWKCSSDASTDWVIYDSARDTYNVMGEYLFPNSSAAGATNAGVDFLSNGFKIKLAGGGSTNTSGRTYIGFAFAEVPFKFALGR